MNTVSVKFSDCYTGKTYDYITDQIHKVGDYVVVRSYEHKPIVVQVVKFQAFLTDKATKPIICAIDLNAYQAKVDALTAEAARRKRRAEIEAELDRRLFARDRYDRYLALALDDPEAAALLTELRGL
jgi:hypothetical protein